MKQFTKHTLYVVAVVIAAQLFTSCGSVGLTKMRYNKGYNLEIFTSKKKREKEEKEFLAMREAAAKKRAEKQAAQKQREAQNDAEEPTLALDQPMPVLVPEAVNTEDNNTAAASSGVKVADEVKSYAKNKNLRKEVRDVMKKEGISFKDIKKQVKYIKQYQHSPEKAESNNLEVDMILLIILAILIPPLAVYLHEDELNDTFIINLILTLLCWLPGVIHALIVISR